MKPHLIAIAATAVLTCGIGAASAADHQPMQKSSPSAMQSMAKDSLSLTPSQQRTAWKDISRHATIQTAPSGFTASVGTALPVAITPRILPSEAAADVPALKPYDYALLQDKLLIVNPADEKIVGVINRHA